jgi:hypothetical protein
MKDSEYRNISMSLNGWIFWEQTLLRRYFKEKINKKLSVFKSLKKLVDI